MSEREKRKKIFYRILFDIALKKLKSLHYIPVIMRLFNSTEIVNQGKGIIFKKIKQIQKMRAKILFLFFFFMVIKNAHEIL